MIRKDEDDDKDFEGTLDESSTESSYDSSEETGSEANSSIHGQSDGGSESLDNNSVDKSDCTSGSESSDYSESDHTETESSESDVESKPSNFENSELFEVFARKEITSDSFNCISPRSDDNLETEEIESNSSKSHPSLVSVPDDDQDHAKDSSSFITSIDNVTVTEYKPIIYQYQNEKLVPEILISFEDNTYGPLENTCQRKTSMTEDYTKATMNFIKETQYLPADYTSGLTVPSHRNRHRHLRAQSLNLQSKSSPFDAIANHSEIGTNKNMEYEQISLRAEINRLNQSCQDIENLNFAKDKEIESLKKALEHCRSENIIDKGTIKEISNECYLLRSQTDELRLNISKEKKMYEAEIDQYSKKIKQAEEDITALKKNTSEIKNELTKEKDSMFKKLMQTNEELHKVKSCLENSENDYKKAIEYAKTVESELMSLKTKNESLHKTITEQESQTQSKESQYLVDMKSLNSKLNQMTVNFESIAKEKQTLEISWTQTLQELEQANLKLNVLGAELQSQKDKYANFEMQKLLERDREAYKLKEAESIISKKECTISSLQKNLSKLRSELSQKDNDAKNLTIIHEELSSKINVLNNELSSFYVRESSNRTEYSKELKKLQKQIIDSEKQKDGLKNNAASLSANLNIKKRLLDEMEKYNTGLQLEVKSLNDAVSTYERKLDNFNNKLRENIVKNASHVQKCCLIESSIDKLKVEYQSFEPELHSLQEIFQNELLELQLKQDHLLSELNATQTESQLNLDKYRSNCEVLEAKIDDMQNLLDQKDITIVDHEAAISTLEDTLKHATEEKIISDQKFEQLAAQRDAEINKIRVELQFTQKQLLDATNEIHRRSKEADDLNVSSLALRVTELSSQMALIQDKYRSVESEKRNMKKYIAQLQDQKRAKEEKFTEIQLHLEKELSKLRLELSNTREIARSKMEEMLFHVAEKIQNNTLFEHHAETRSCLPLERSELIDKIKDHKIEQCIVTPNYGNQKPDDSIGSVGDNHQVTALTDHHQIQTESYEHMKNTRLVPIVSTRDFDTSDLDTRLHNAYQELKSIYLELLNIGYATGLQFSNESIDYHEMSMKIVSNINALINQRDANQSYIRQLEDLLEQAICAGKCIQQKKELTEQSANKKDVLLKRFATVLNDSASAIGKRRISQTFLKNIK